jgi:putative heme-binding domain-containing protein
MHRCPPVLPLLCVGLSLPFVGAAQLPAPSPARLAGPTLDKQLQAEDIDALARQARSQGDARRGAVVFYQPSLACRQCHRPESAEGSLGPDLTRKEARRTDRYLIESILHPSRDIVKGFEGVTVQLVSGKVLTGLVVKKTAKELLLRDLAGGGKVLTIPMPRVDVLQASKTSLMPAGQMNQLTSRQQFLDLVRYLMAIRDGGRPRALELEPAPELYAARPLPDYEKNLDHAGLIADLNDQSFKRGEAIYQRLCINCHGTHDRPGSLPTSLPFASGTFKNGSDPHSMYQTLTRGFGMMAPQTWMVPQQKYDVIHYIREAYLKKYNPGQYYPVDRAYLARLPKGTSRGPAPTNMEPWVTMDYGPTLINTYEVPGEKRNFAYKGIAVRLDPGPGGVSRGRHWMVFDHDTLRMAGAWSGKGFIDWNGIHFNGQHQVHPHLVDTVQVANPLLGWASPKGDFVDTRLKGRDGRHYGPLPRNWAHYRGLYHHGQQAIISYTVGDTEVLEMPGLANAEAPVFTRTFHLGPRTQDQILMVAQEPQARGTELELLARTTDDPGIALLGSSGSTAKKGPSQGLDGATRFEVSGADAFDMTGKDYSISARVRTRRGGSIFAKAPPHGQWVPDGKSLFVRGGNLVFDIGWVGMVRSRHAVADGNWHDLAMTWEQKTGRVQLYVDGKRDGEGTLRPKKRVAGHVVHLGYTAPNFPRRQTFFQGDLAEVRFYQRALAPREIARLADLDQDRALLARWRPDALKGSTLTDETGNKHEGRVLHGETPATRKGLLAVGLSEAPAGARWKLTTEGALCLRIPAGKAAMRFALWMTRVANKEEALARVPQSPVVDLTTLTHGGPRHWRTTLKLPVIPGKEDGAFAVDVLTIPSENPWSCRVRLGGFDFFPDGKRLAVCSWDGDVWLVSGLDHLENGLTWQRIASGLFQPLGLKVVNGQIYVTCRDQIVILHDLNGDGETDFYENFNNDHQVTEHFHEFAMGLQVDREGNFYYAKSARHALPALVPHHGTLLRVSKDGSHTDIIATGFRAANGVCLNPDGTFFVTDQEGHWTPKNRINWVREGHFYGNMYGYSNVTDTSDEAMEPPVCWITNSFDRSPAELVWVDSKTWGPLEGALLNLSYGYGKIFVVPHERVGERMQGGMSPLPIPSFPTGIMRGRFHPGTGNLYACGLFAWAGNQQQPGGFYRIRYTGKPVYVPLQLSARKKGMSITFSAPLDPKTAGDPERYFVHVWSLKRTANYGSKHYGEQRWTVKSARLERDGKTVFLEIPEMRPTMCMEIRYEIRGKDGEIVKSSIHNTIHELVEKQPGGRPR